MPNVIQFIDLFENVAKRTEFVLRTFAPKPGQKLDPALGVAVLAPSQVGRMNRMGDIDPETGESSGKMTPDQIVTNAIKEHLKLVVACDPTADRTAEFVPWIYNQTRNLQAKDPNRPYPTIVLPEDTQSVHDILTRFVAEKMRLPADKRDINKFKSPGEIAELIDGLEELGLDNVTTKRGYERIQIQNGIDLIFQSGDWKLVEASEFPAMLSMLNNPNGKIARQNVCITQSEHTFYQNYKPPIYLVFLYNDQPMAFMHCPTNIPGSGNQAQLKNVYDREITDSGAGSQVLKELKNNPDFTRAVISYAADNWGGVKNTLHRLRDILNKEISEELLQSMAKASPSIAAALAVEIRRGRWPEMEELIASSPRAAAKYAVELLKGNWPSPEYRKTCENIIAGDARATLVYAEGGAGETGNSPKRFLQGERAVLLNAFITAKYAASVYVKVEKGRWPEGEAALERAARSSNIAPLLDYCRDVIDHRWPEMEKYFAKDPVTACTYVSEIDGAPRWPHEVEMKMKDRLASAPNPELVMKWAEYCWLLLINEQVDSAEFETLTGTRPNFI